MSHGITNIPGHFFNGCRSLNSVILPPNLTTLSASAFYYSKIQNLELPSTLTTIGTSCFEASSINSITLPEGLLTINNGAFARCSLSGEVIIPNSVTTLGNRVFYGAQNITSIKIGTGITSIPDGLFDAYMSGDNKTYDMKLQKVYIKGDVTSIGSRAFYKCTKLDGIYKVKANGTNTGFDWSKLNSIGDYAFYNCSSLSGNITLSTTCSLGEETFEGCTANVSR